MKKNMFSIILGAGVLSLVIAGTGAAQVTPGFSLGGFFEYRVENQINNDDISFTYYGARLGFRDERWVELFLEGGGEGMSFEPFDDKTTGAFGLGGTFWLMRYQYGYGPFDLGIYGSVHFADYSSVKIKDTAEKTDIKHYRYMGQIVIRGVINQDFKAFLRGGILGTKLDPSSSLIDNDDLDKIKPAINAGVELQLARNLIATLELNYSESVGGAIHLDYWF
ncbi:MAG: hypothetical protein RAO92_03390 [Candidatus Euphemobacter frigidus]|nr:hypothetical protein [Candidatus Euphemobacter frigidus]MDP8275425.1 hypothetical protein [Candidatus Euphemobacter frigidus]